MRGFLNGFLKGMMVLLPVMMISIGVLYFMEDKNPPIETPANNLEQTEKNSVSDEIIADMVQDPLPAITEEAPITLCFAGDMLFTEHPLSRYNRNGISSMASEELLTHMTNSDIFMVNEEFPFSLRGVAAEKEYTFRVDPKYTSIFHDLGVDIVTVANNHALDFGTEAFLDSIDTLDAAGIDHVGGGRTLDDAKAPVIKEIGNKTIGFLGASRVIPVSSWAAGKNHPGMLTTYDPSILLRSIEELKSNCDYVVVYVHWGIEKDTMPQEYQRELARAYIDAGADAVIGAHPHVMQGFEFYNGKPIAYSLGNFLFSNSKNQTVLYKITLNSDDGLTMSIIPCIRKDGQMQLMSEPQEYYDYLESLSFDVTIDANGSIVPR